MKKCVWIITGIVFILVSQWVFGQAPKAPKKTPEILNQGKKLYEQNCSVCHGSKGDGKGPAGATLQPAPTNFSKPLREWPNTKGDPNKVFEVITKGIPNSAMVKWDQFSEQERWALVYTVVGFATPKAPPKKN